MNGGLLWQTNGLLSVLGRLSIVAGSIVATLLLGWTCHAATAAQEQRDQILVGDLIDFEFLGKRQQQTVLEITGNGLLRVEADSNGRKIKFLVAPRQVLLIERPSKDLATHEYRTWTDATGNFKVEAKVLELNDTEVKLLKKDQLVITIPLEKLSQPDQLFVKQLQEQAGNPTNEMGNSAVNRRRDEIIKKAFDKGEFPVTARKVKPTNELRQESVPWVYSPAESAIHSRDVSVPLPTDFEKNDLIYTKLLNNGHASEIINICRRSHKTKVSQILLFNTVEEKFVGDYTLPTDDILDVVVSPSLGTMATLLDGTVTHTGGIVFWRIENGQLIPYQAWEFDSIREKDRFFATDSLFVDEHHFLTIGSHIALWNISDGKCIYSISKPGVWAISRDHSHLAFAQSDALWMLRLKDGKITGRMTADPKYIKSLKQMDFSPDGKSLVMSNGRVLHGFDLTNGQGLFSTEPEQAISSVQWADNSLLFLNDKLIFDPNLEVSVWNVLVIPGLGKNYRGSTTWVCSDDRIYSLELVDEERRNAISGNTEGLEAKDLLAFEPGTRIALIANLQHLHIEADETVSALRHRLEELGFVLDDNAPLRLEAVVRRGQEVEEIVAEQFGIGIGLGRERIRYTPHSSHLLLTLDGKLLWQVGASYTAKGPVLMLNANETPQQAVNRLCRPNPAFFTNAKIPKKISRLPKNRTVGTLRITPGGVY